MAHVRASFTKCIPSSLWARKHHKGSSMTHISEADDSSCSSRRAK
ncbi:hypothetical protein AZE42_13361 [Rhizopogon vesiculosus]|uniref:Uncharacterized protein n=1 Tax=Rhizopogon vesiculosus TaxID=180088 RepID=A0A1J8QM19_9AGAM|nr:hypothetical protein AZE42_13361 [Rhizopogon vesiculosus]